MIQPLVKELLHFFCFQLIQESDHAQNRKAWCHTPPQHTYKILSHLIERFSTKCAGIWKP
jgi:hypothetical protein